MSESRNRRVLIDEKKHGWSNSASNIFWLILIPSNVWSSLFFLVCVSKIYCWSDPSPGFGGASFLLRSVLVNKYTRTYSCKFMHIWLHCSPSGSGREISVFNYPISHSARFSKMADWGEFCSTRAQSSKFHFDVTISFSVCFVPLRRRRVRTSRFWC